MNLNISKKANVNYLAKVVDIQTFSAHPDPATTKLKLTHVDGYNIVVGVDSNPGLYVYFPTSCEINPKFLSHCNLYRKGDKNADPEKTGFFEDNGRVKAIKLRGVVSEGFLMEWSTFSNFLVENFNKTIEDPKHNTEFDSISDGDKEFWICKKYIVVNKFSTSQTNTKYQKNVKKFNRVIDTQFRFHYETEQLRKNPTNIKPDDLISITSKIHGTSVISAYVLCKSPKKWFQFWKPNVVYDYLYSSRKVIKNANYRFGKKQHYYGCDVWKYADDYLRPFLQKGMSIYAEIVGFLPNGGYIQKNYDYGCVPPKSEDDYQPEVNFKVRVYRITLTNVDGQVHEFSAREVQQWCKNNGLIPVTEFYYGLAKDLYPDLNISEHWNENFLEKLSNDKNFYMELNSPDCSNKVPHEGIVIRKEDMWPASFKVKSFAFYNLEAKQLDAGESNVEDEN